MLLIGINEIMRIFLHLDIEFDYFYKTSSAENIAFVQDVFDKLNDAGHISMKKRLFNFIVIMIRNSLPDRYVKGVCPYCNAEDQYSDLCESCGRVPDEII